MAVPDSIMRAVRRVRPLSASALQLVQVVADENYNVEELVAVIKVDAALTGAVLRTVNSAAYGFNNTIDSVRRAVSYLGARMVVGIAMKQCAGHLYDRDLGGYAAAKGDLWRHSLRTAIGAGTIARKVGGDLDPAAAYTAGILHDLGKAVLVDVLAKRREAPEGSLAEILGGDDVEFLSVERELTGTDHCEVGGALGENWSLPKNLVSAMRRHHRPHVATPEHRAITYAVHLGDGLAMMAGIGTGADILGYELDPNYRRHFDISPAELQLLMIDIDDEYRQAESALNLAS